YTFISFLLLLFFLCYADLRDLHSFPTRRSSDLELTQSAQLFDISGDKMKLLLDFPTIGEPHYAVMVPGDLLKKNQKRIYDIFARSEEHTSELQSRENLVCRLLLEKKK